uniref:Uncharacterized protein n=1 Tax=Anguilla anguilla TaxID=7936 RepID=A0A0E9RCE4_ANGAN
MLLFIAVTIFLLFMSRKSFKFVLLTNFPCSEKHNK